MSSTPLGTAIRAARKEHGCFWCSDPIVAGEQYRELRVAEDGRVDMYRMHVECEAAEARAYDYTAPLHGEASCLNVDIDGGSHARGENCCDCSDITVPQETASHAERSRPGRPGANPDLNPVGLVEESQ